MARDLERLFDRFRRKGDTKALARVFDRTARDLLALAQHLVTDVGDAEDLVQTTFVTAIDRAHTFDSEQPLRPWLAGILAKHAANWNRRQRTRLAHRDASEQEGLPDPSPTRSPWRQASQAELERSVQEALHRLPARYRRVLQPYLLDTQQPEQIARTLGEAPGTVRTQIHRGLERLRRILPAGALVGYAGSTRGWGAVRSFVLQHAQTSAAQLSVGGASLAVGAAGSWIPGGIVLAQKALMAGSLAVAASLAWMAWPGEASEAPREVMNPELRAASVPERVESAALAPAESVGAALEAAAAPGPEAQGTRTVVANGKVMLHGRLLGVDPADWEGLEWSVSQLAEASYTESISEGEHPPSPPMIGGKALGSLPLVRFHDVTEEGGVSSSWSLEYPEQEVLWTRPLAGVTVHADGAFSIDLSAQVLDQSDQFEIQVRHGLYTEAHASFSFGARARERMTRGEHSSARVELTLRPLAILKGKVKRQGDDEFIVSYTPSASSESSEEAGGEEESAKPVAAPALIAWEPPKSDDEGLEEKLAQISLQLEMATLELSAQKVSHAWLIRTQGIQVALFRYGATEPTATASCSFDGGFELRCVEEGTFLLVAIQDGYPLFCQEVQLALRTVKSLEEALPIPQRLALSGQVDDFGLFPKGGLGVQAERMHLQDPIPFDWKQEPLVWDGRRVVRRVLQGATQAGGAFALEGASEGEFRVRVHEPALQWMWMEGDEAAVEVRTPHQQVFLSLPASVIEFSVADPGWSPRDVERAQKFTWTLEVQTQPAAGKDGETLGRMDLHAEDGQPVLLRPGARIRLLWLDPEEGAQQEVWAGQAGPTGSWDREALVLPLPEGTKGQ